jgi:hypothetical protein
MEKTMKNFIMILCLLMTPLSFAYGDDSSGEGSNSSSKSGGGYGSGSGGSAAALIAVGAIVYYIRKNSNNEESQLGLLRKFEESKFDISFGNRRSFQDNFSNYQSDSGLLNNNFQINLKYNFN